MDTSSALLRPKGVGMKKQSSGQVVARWIGYAVFVLTIAWITATVVGYLTGAAAHAFV